MPNIQTSIYSCASEIGSDGPNPILVLVIGFRVADEYSKWALSGSKTINPLWRPAVQFGHQDSSNSLEYPVFKYKNSKKCSFGSRREISSGKSPGRKLWLRAPLRLFREVGKEISLSHELSAA